MSQRSSHTLVLFTLQCDGADNAMHLEEPVAGNLLGGFCGGGRGQPLPLPDTVGGSSGDVNVVESVMSMRLTRGGADTVNSRK